MRTVLWTTVSGALLSGCATVPPGVAPWDVPDDPNPHPSAPSSAPPLRDPAGLIRATGPSATTSTGVKITLTSIARKLPEGGKEVTPDALAVWRPDGSPAGFAPRDNTIGYGPAATMIDKGARLLTFEIEGGSVGSEASVTGYVPDGAKEGTPEPEYHGWDQNPSRLWDRVHSAWVVVDDRKASHYRIAVADGPWRTIASGVLPTYRRQTETILAGPWGQVRHVVIPRPMAAKWTMQDEYGSYVVEPATLAPDDELRVRFTLKPTGTRGFWPPKKGDPFVVEARPWHWVELSNIHYNPDPTKWPKDGIWGDEGKATIQKTDGVALEAIATFGKDQYGGWMPETIYAPNGKRWRNHPDAQALQPRIGGGTLPNNSLIALLRFDPGQVSRERPAHVECYAATSDRPGKGLSKLLGYFQDGTFPQEIGHLPFTRPKTPYVQFAVSYADPEWKSVATIPAPRLVPFPLTAEQRGYFAKGSYSAEAFVVGLAYKPEGAFFSLRLSGDPGPRTERKLNLSEEGRIVAVLNSGEKVPLDRNTWAFGGVGPNSFGVSFYLDSDGGAHYQSPVTNREFRLRDLKSFEVQERGYSDPTYLVAKLP